MDEGLELTEVIIHPNTNGYSDGEVVPADSKDVSVKAYKHTDGKFYALITPTMPVSDMYNYLLFMTVKVAKPDGTGEQEFEVRRIPHTGTEAGSSYEYFLKIGKDELVVDKITVSDWKTGEAIPGGEALDDVEFVKKTIADALAANKTDIELTLNSYYNSSELSAAIRDALKTTTDGSVNLTLKDITFFQTGLDNYINHCNKLKSITLPDATEFSMWAFANCDKLEEIYAPNVSVLGSRVFNGCKGLKKIALGALTNVTLGDDSEAFFGLETENVDLVLSESQKQMENRNNWYSTEEDYKSTDDYTKNIFLGRQFKSVTLQ